MKKKNIKHFLIGSGIGVAAVAAISSISYSITKKLVTFALDREDPRISRGPQKKAEPSPEEEELLTLQQNAAEKLLNSGCRTVKITAHDGETLVGHLQVCRHAKRTILAMHGWRSSWLHDFSLISDFWRENRCNVLYVEQRGQGESGGKYMSFGLIERYDCLDWARWLNDNGFSGLPLYLAGLSMGAATVLMAAGLELPSNVCGIMADCAFTSPQAIWKHVAENTMHIAYHPTRQKVVDDLCREKIQVGADEYSCVDAMRVCKVPVLFIHGTDDHFVPVEMTYENYKACAAPKRLFVVPGAEHGMSYLVDRHGYEAEVKRFWRACDRRLKGKA